jgi:hypothetical protein
MRLAALAAALAMTPALAAADKDTRVFEMRTYYAAPGKLEALHARFRDHTAKLFTRHGMENIGYFVPLGDNPENKLVYFLAYPTREARDKSWAAFLADPAWVKAKAESEKGGKLVEKVEQRFLAVTDYSPPLYIENKGGRVFELRVYTTPKGRLPHLNDRFKDHTIKLFEKHGMTNVVYWTPTADQPDKDVTLVYLLAHKSREAAAESFKTFRADPDWQAVRMASEAKAGGSLTEPKGGVVSVFVKPADYSPLK